MKFLLVSILSTLYLFKGFNNHSGSGENELDLEIRASGIALAIAIKFKTNSSFSYTGEQEGGNETESETDLMQKLDSDSMFCILEHMDLSTGINFLNSSNELKQKTTQ